MPSDSHIKLTEHAKVLIVDDNPDLIRLMGLRLKPMNFELKSAESAEEALSVLATWSPNLVITDLQMPGMSGMELFQKIHSKDPLVPVIILTAHGTIPDAVEATQSGVTSFLTKPFDSKRLLEEVRDALLNSGYIKKPSTVLDNQPPLATTNTWREKIISKSPIIDNLIHQLDRLSSSDSLLLFTGEAGSGKSLFARAAHNRSERRNGPYVHISSKSLPERLLDIELYGQVGSGTLKSPERLGLFREAEGGTLVLNDFESATPDFLHKLLNALITKKIRPIDSDVAFSIDVRPMTTTLGTGGYSQNQKLAWELGGQLDITSFKIPPLRERREDIPIIANNTLAQLPNKQELQFSNKAMQILLSEEWPGNIRQLTNTVRQCARLCNTKVISESLLNSRLKKSSFKVQTLSSAHLDFERNYLIEILKATNGNVTKASQLAERNRTEFHRLLKKHKMEASSFRQ